MYTRADVYISLLRELSNACVMCEFFDPEKNVIVDGRVVGACSKYNEYVKPNFSCRHFSHVDADELLHMSTHIKVDPNQLRMNFLGE